MGLRFRWNSWWLGNIDWLSNFNWYRIIILSYLKHWSFSYWIKTTV